MPWLINNQSIILFVSNYILHKDLSIQTVKNVSKISYKRLHSNLLNHRNPPITGLSVPIIPILLG